MDIDSETTENVEATKLPGCRVFQEAEYKSSCVSGLALGGKSFNENDTNIAISIIIQTREQSYQETDSVFEVIHGIGFGLEIFIMDTEEEYRKHKRQTVSGIFDLNDGS